MTQFAKLEEVPLDHFAAVLWVSQREMPAGLAARLSGKRVIYLEGEAIEMLGLYPAATMDGIVKAAQLEENDIIAISDSKDGNINVAIWGNWDCKFNYTLRASWSVPTPSITSDSLLAANCK